MAEDVRQGVEQGSPRPPKKRAAKTVAEEEEEELPPMVTTATWTAKRAETPAAADPASEKGAGKDPASEKGAGKFDSENGFEEMSVDEESYALIEDMPEDDESSEGEGRKHEVLSEISNETDLSDGMDFQPPITDRQAALLVPEPPWAKITRPCKKLLSACLFPLCLVIFILYAVFRILIELGRCSVQILACLEGGVWVVCRCAAWPVVEAWTATMPVRVQKFVRWRYEIACEPSVIKLIDLRKEAIELLKELPSCSAACIVAIFETCVVPLFHGCMSLLHKVAGRRAEDWILKPMHSARINLKFRYKHDRFHSVKKHTSEVDIKRMQEKQRRLRAKKRALRERARRMRLKKKADKLNIALMLPLDDDAPPGEAQQLGGFGDRTHQLADKSRADLIARTLHVERRYAVAVAFIWFMIGCAILVVTLDGHDGESCNICQQRGDVKLRICRHAQGQDCAFQLHSTEIIVAIAIMGVGGLLSVYALCLYRPSGKVSEVKQQEFADALAAENASLMTVRKEEDIELMVVKRVIADLERNTFGRQLRKLWKRIFFCTESEKLNSIGNRPLRALLDWDERHRLQERSIRLQEIMYFMGLGWIGALWRLVCCKGRRRDSSGGSGSLGRTFTSLGGMKTPGSKRASCIKRLSRTQCAKWFRRCGNRIAWSRCGRCVARVYGRSRTLQFIGRKFYYVYTVLIDKPSIDRVWEDTIIKGGVRVGAVGGTKRLELVLANFGLNEPEEEKDDGQLHGLHRLRFDEYQREPGMDGDNAPVDDEPDFKQLLPGLDEESNEDDLGAEGLTDDELEWADDAEEGPLDTYEHEDSFDTGSSMGQEGQESEFGIGSSGSDWTVEEIASGSDSSTL